MRSEWGVLSPFFCDDCLNRPFAVHWTVIRFYVLIGLLLISIAGNSQNEALLSKAEFYVHRIPDSTLIFLQLVSKSTLDSNQLFQTRRLEGEAFKLLSRYQEADSLISLNVHNAELGMNPRFRMWSINDLANLRWRLGRYREADSLFSLISMEELTPVDSSFLAELAVNKALLYWNMGRYESSLELSFEALKIAEGISDYYNEGRAWNTIGLVEMDRENFDQAKAPLSKALQINKKYGFRRGLCVNQNNLALIHKYNGQNDSALIEFERVIQLTDSFGFKNDQTRALHNLGDVYQNLGRYDEALSVKLRSLEMANELDLKRNITLACNTIGEVYLQQGKWKQAIKYSERARVTAEKEENVRQAYFANFQLSKAYQELGDLNQAIHYLHKATSYREKMLNEQLNDRVAYYRELYESEKVKKKLDERSRQLEVEKEQRRLGQARWTIAIVGVLVAAVMLLLLIQKNNQKKVNKRQKQFAQDLIQTQEEERVRIAKELHDGVGQNLSVVKNMASNASANSQLADQVQVAIDELRLISRNLHPIELVNFGLKKAIENLVKQTSAYSGIFTTHDIQISNLKLSKDHEINLYRIVQEGLNNSIKHSKATAAKVSLIHQEDYLILEIQDNGIGFNTDRDLWKGMGMTSLQERTAILNGYFKVVSSSNQGTLIYIKCPVKPL